MIKVIGCGDAFGSGGRLNTCFYVQLPEVNFLIDCGATSLVGLKQQGVSPDDIDMIILTHFHGDHFGGLPYLLLHAAKLDKRSKPLSIISPPGCRQRLEILQQELYPGTKGIIDELNLEFIEYFSGEVIKFNDLTVNPFPVVHFPDSLPHALRIESKDATIGFSGDTEWCENLIHAARDTDIFICECNFYEPREKAGHLDYRTLRANSGRLETNRLLLTHMGDRMLTERNNLEFESLEDGMEVGL